MVKGREEAFFGFIVHAYPDLRRDRLYLLGRLEDGRSFAAVEENWRPYIHICEKDRNRAVSLLTAFKFEETAALESFSGAEKLACFKFANYGERSRAAAALGDAQINSPDSSIKPADFF